MFVAVLGAALLVLALPRFSRAGLFSSLTRFFGVSLPQVEESGFSFIPESQAAADASALDAENRLPDSDGREDESGPASVVQNNALLAPLNPLGTMSAAASPEGQIFVYTIRSGDTLSGIAKSFGVSVNTILWANSISSERLLKTGDQIVILPVSGVKHKVQKGDTLSSVARKYQATVEDIRQFNGLAPGEGLVPGMSIIVPNGELRESAPLGSSAGEPRSFSTLPNFGGFYARPIVGGRRSRGLHGFNGVDLASSCGLPVLASADGAVLLARASGWNGGYGRYLVLAHANGTQTLYAHLKEISVGVSRSVRQGEVIGTIGSSGNSTGCHVHFEVRGARNPF